MNLGDYLWGNDGPIDRVRAALRKGRAALVLVDDPLPDGASAIVRIGAGPPLDCYAVVSRSVTRDEEIATAVHIPVGHYMEHPRSEGPVTITLYPDGREVSESVVLGRHESRPIADQPGGAEEAERSFGASLRRAVEKMQPTVVPGIGPARVYRLPWADL